MALLLPLIAGSVAAAVIFINYTRNEDDIPDDIPDQDIDTAITQVLGPGFSDLPSPSGPSPSGPSPSAPVTFSYTSPPSEYGPGYDQYGNFDPSLLP
jgi:hypothetical protein